MPDYLTTREVAKLLRLTEKKVYALVAEGRLPSSRVSGKWLFPRRLVDEWIAANTRFPGAGLLGSLADDLIILQGSDDWLLGRAVERYQSSAGHAVPQAAVGSVAGLAAIRRGTAHAAGCHLERGDLRRRLAETPCYVLQLFEREQGLIAAKAKVPDLAAAAARPTRFAARQAGSGTALLVDRLLGESRPAWTVVGPYHTHLDVAHAVRTGAADLGVGIRLAADFAGLAFRPLAVEQFSLVYPVSLSSHPKVARFLDALLTDLRLTARRGLPGYRFETTGRLETT